ncbi:RAMP superfamily CRISPR-associated protein [Rhodospirillum rubrum]|uniref:CRISPR type III-associated protein domain-containing protein n=1 Tax=Rhodospirillum rubrum (strain ATCC 11170 / ATH 1.1.1 / DSM 467 / LMG 4362 / NCIMB 8255 / S1) TaxID=269796 RepID=Q2RY06_RHORT|nr:RAMP superfamily CRISPR-associated protein [Rhodospirillum rubrum]ABC20989.1 Protein of unknown function DUF324 [Rhodospirillum rubrum ATCC 11170]AEO46654.1 hypothetical protein F11_00920 [Rhodospirillum rubrum F11]QXG80686.1 hypothetical protein KUL73_00975 [Rhodospirillum rubrum]HAQ01190.1 hypothetical protein [Rhodospirillum rubrum]HCF19278.1 hypothetical protein [Rhodospirillum rubrum]
MSASLQTADRVRRWRIEGELTTRTPLHMGSGSFEARQELRRAPQTDDIAKAKAVLLDSDQRPCLTGSGLKGAMLAWANAYLPDPERDRLLFGCEPDGDGKGQGGRLEFQTAFLSQNKENTSPSSSPTPFWMSDRRTDVDTGVRINRASGTALDKHLFYKEVVAPGTAFRMVLDLDLPACCTDKGHALVNRVLALLEAFNLSDDDRVPPLTLGAMTGRGHGRFAWRLTNLSRVTDASARTWIDKGAPGTWAAALTPVPDKGPWQTTAKATLEVVQSPATLVCEVTLTFDHRFLISEPARVVTEDEARTRSGKTRTAGIMPKVDGKGNAVLPTASIKGVLRSRAERILATLTGDASAFEHAPGRGPAGQDNPAADMMTDRCLPTSRLFGAASWRAALDVEPFRPLSGHTTVAHQELVAIDRFTGGVSGSAKYDIDAFHRPQFKGRLRLNLRRSRLEDVGLLVLLLRDLAEGDLSFGYGGTKGYGGTQAMVTVQVRGTTAGTQALPLPEETGGAGIDTPVSWSSIQDSALASPLREAVAAFRRLYCKGEAV